MGAGLIRRLLIRPGAIGDFIVSLPALEALQADYTEVWCASQNVPLARFADRARSIVGAGLDRVGLLEADEAIERLQRFDSIVSWYGTNRAEFRELVGRLGLPVQFLAALPDGRGHAVDFYNAQAVGLGGSPRSRFPRIECPAGERTFAAIHPFASSAGKRADMSVFDAVAERLGESMPVRWVCGPEEALDGERKGGARAPRANEVVRPTSDRAAESGARVTRIEDLYELACWLRRARIFVGNDSGISHLAAAVGTPVQVFFRTTDKRVWAPRGVAVNVSVPG